MPTVTKLDGWYDEEHDGVRPFRWIGREARCRITGVRGTGPFYLQLVAAHSFAGQSSRLSVSVNGRVIGERSIGVHACRYAFPLEPCNEVDL